MLLSVPVVLLYLSFSQLIISQDFFLRMALQDNHLNFLFSNISGPWSKMT